MNQSDLIKEVSGFIEENIKDFHNRRVERLRSLKLRLVLKRKNPYLFKAKYIVDAHDLVKLLLDAHLSSQEETIFGDLLEKLAIFVCSKVYGGRKSSAEGIDLEFLKDNVLYIVSVKSGPNWGNSSQVRRMEDNFRKAKKILRTNQPGFSIQAVNGCCYGKDSNPDKGDYFKLCGQEFWNFISGNDQLYIEIIEPLGHRAKERNEAFQMEYSRILNLFTQQFIQEFCVNGTINWVKLVEFNSKKDS